MKEQPFTSAFHEKRKTPGFGVEGLHFLENGPYSFSLPPGVTLGLSGPSGIGKSQLLRAIVDIIPHTGEMYLDGVPCSQYAAPHWRKLVAYVPPDSVWWKDRVQEHFPGAVDEIQLGSWLEELSFSMDVMNWQVSRLSTGERQRIALLRALLNSPSVLLLDEPSSALDPFLTEKLEKLVQAYQEKHDVPIIWVTHDREQLLRISDRAMIVEKDGLQPDTI